MLILLVLHVVVTAALLMVVAWIVPGIRVDGAQPALVGALVLGVANALVRPILILLTLPLTIVTLGLFLFVVNALMLMLAARIVRGFAVDGFGAALAGSVLLSLLHAALLMLVRR
jgi:putative membrane protein